MKNERKLSRRRRTSCEPVLEDRVLLAASIGFSFDVITSDLHPTFRAFGSPDGAPSTIIRYGDITVGSINDLPGLSALVANPSDITVEFGSDDVNNIEEVATLSSFDNGLADGIANQVFTPDGNDDPEMTLFHNGVPAVRGELIQVALEITPQSVVTSPSGSSFRILEPIGSDTALFDELMAASDFTGVMDFTLDPFQYQGTWAGVGDAERFISQGDIQNLTTQPVQLADTGILEVLGTSAADTIVVTETATDVTVSVGGQDFPYTIAAGTVRNFAVTDVVVKARGGNDHVTHAGTGTSLAVVFNGGSGSDTLIGNNAADRLLGNGGRDKLVGNGGNDDLRGGNGPDRLEGGDGDDALRGGPGNDNLQGGRGDDRGFGGSGDDLLNGGSGEDALAGEGGHDRLIGGSAADDLDGGSGNDTLLGGGGADLLDGFGGNDEIHGGPGNDIIWGDIGNDLLNGDDGADLIMGESGIDTMNGGAGRDFLSGGGGRDIMNGGSDDDILIGAATDADDNLSALSAILSEWTSSKPYATRVANLQDGSGGNRFNGSFFLPDLVGADGGRNVMSGNENDDYFWGLGREVTDLGGIEVRDSL